MVGISMANDDADDVISCLASTYLLELLRRLLLFWWYGGTVPTWIAGARSRGLVLPACHFARA